MHTKYALPPEVVLRASWIQMVVGEKDVLLDCLLFIAGIYIPDSGSLIYGLYLDAF